MDELIKCIIFIGSVLCVSILKTWPPKCHGVTDNHTKTE